MCGCVCVCTYMCRQGTACCPGVWGLEEGNVVEVSLYKASDPQLKSTEAGPQGILKGFVSPSDRFMAGKSLPEMVTWGRWDSSDFCTVAGRGWVAKSWKGRQGTGWNGSCALSQAHCL